MAEPVRRALALRFWIRLLVALAGALGTLMLARAQPTSAHLGPAQVASSLTQYKIDVWQTEQGLPLNTVQALLQTRAGHLWVGTAGGLARFDGYRFTSIQAPQAPELSGQPIFGLMEDAHGRVWIGHAKGALLYVGGRTHTVIGPELTQGRRVWAFAQDRDGAVWAATENGLVRWERGQTRRYGTAEGLPSTRLRTLCFDRDGTLWIGTTGAGLVAMRGNRFQVFEAAQGFPHSEVRAVLADPEGGVWAATAGGGLAHVQGTSVRSWGVRDGLPTDQLSALARDASGALWLGTWGAGVVRFKDGQFRVESARDGLAGNQVWSLLADAEGSIWVGTWVDGLNRLRRRSFVMWGVPEGLSHDNTRAVLHTRRGITWVSTAGGGVNRIDGAQVTRWGRAEGLPSDEASTLVEDRRDGALWIGTYTAGVVRLQGKRVQVFGQSAGGLPSSDVRSLYQDRDGTVWAGTRAGLARWDGRAFVAVRDPGAPLEGVNVIVQDHRGALWFGTPGQGLVRWFQGQYQRWTRSDGLVSNWVLSLHEDADGDLWVGTNGGGLNRVRVDQVDAVRPKDGLWDGNVQAILEDRLGNFWITCNRGFFRVERASLRAFLAGRASGVRSSAFGPGDGLRSTTFAGGLQGAGAVDARGHLWLPSSKGLVLVDPDHLPLQGDPPAVTLEGLTVDGQDQTAGAELTLQPGTVPLALRYTALTLGEASRVRFRTKMEGLNRSWVDAGNNREVSFPALPPGRYLFQVAASLDGQRWREMEPPLSVRVLPRLHQTAGFWLLAGLVAAILAYLWFQWRTLRLRRQHADMEALVALRTEELRQANEHLSRLSFEDALTGLANRRAFDRALDEEWRRAVRTQQPLALIMADIDGFKAYNDALGHPEGDRCLQQVARVFAPRVGRAGDIAARYGGEEFIVLLLGADMQSAHRVGESLRSACEALGLPHPQPSPLPVVTLSVGVVACRPAEGRLSEREFLDLADQALYRAKQGGRNRVCN